MSLSTIVPSCIGVLTHKEDNRSGILPALAIESLPVRFQIEKSYHSTKRKRVDFDLRIKELYLELSVYDRPRAPLLGNDKLIQCGKGLLVGRTAIGVTCGLSPRGLLSAVSIPSCWGRSCELSGALSRLHSPL